MAEQKLSNWHNPEPFLGYAQNASKQMVEKVLEGNDFGGKELAILLSPVAGNYLEAMAKLAQISTRRHFGRTIQLYAPLYLANYCSGGCLYCGFASDRKSKRSRLSSQQVEHEVAAMQAWGCDEILLLTGERTKEAGYDFLKKSIAQVAAQVNNVSIEVFSMSEDEYSGLVQAGCTGLTLYQETYDAEVYKQVHRWGEKRNYSARLKAPERALRAGVRFVGLGALLGLSNPIYEMISLYQHVCHLQKKYWQAGISVSFPRIRPQTGGFQSSFCINDRYLAQIIFAFRLCLPTVPLVLSTRENAKFRDGMVGLGISKMSVASKTTVGGYSDDSENSEAQFEISDNRTVEQFCAMLKNKGYEPVFKNWEGIYRK